MFTPRYVVFQDRGSGDQVQLGVLKLIARLLLPLATTPAGRRLSRHIRNASRLYLVCTVRVGPALFGGRYPLVAG